jgi:hypothetical protein
MRNTARSTRKSARNTDHTPLTVLYPMGASCGSSNSCFKPFTAAWKNRSAMSVPKVSPEKRVKAWMYSLALTSAKIKCMRAGQDEHPRAERAEELHADRVRALAVLEDVVVHQHDGLGDAHDQKRLAAEHRL